MAESRTKRAEATAVINAEQARTTTRRKIVSIVVFGLIVVFLIGWTGWALNDQFNRPHKAVTVSNTFSGTVTLVNGPGTAGCVTPTSGAKVCSILVPVDGETPRVGERVNVAQEVVTGDGGNRSDLLLLYP